MISVGQYEMIYKGAFFWSMTKTQPTLGVAFFQPVSGIFLLIDIHCVLEFLVVFFPIRNHVIQRGVIESHDLCDFSWEIGKKNAIRKRKYLHTVLKKLKKSIIKKKKFPKK